MSSSDIATGSSCSGSSLSGVEGGGAWVLLAAGGGGGRGSEGAALTAQPLGVAPFESGQYVRLLNRGRRLAGYGGYLFADESGKGVSIGGIREMVNTVWRVQVLETPGGAGADAYHVVLRGAYGRHLAASPRGGADGHIGYQVDQRPFDTMEDIRVMWRTIPVPGSGGDRDVVFLLNVNSSNGVIRALRANGKYRLWNTGVSLQPIDHTDARFSLMMEWEVQVIPMRLHRPPFQTREAARLPFQLARAATCFGRRPQDSRQIQVGIRVADHSGNINVPAAEIMSVPGRSLDELGNAVVRHYGNGFSFQNMSIFIQAGNLGRPFPLLTDLPSGVDDFDVVVFMVGTPGSVVLAHRNC
uniref:DUF569 domain-containing protein n=1 Tax=Leersia perrieri TaxID=77586 RepID=A0A0D9VYB7_9ORYZ